MASSVLASSRSLAGASKIAPHSSCLLPKRPVGSFKFFDGHLEYILTDGGGHGWVNTGGHWPVELLKYLIASWPIGVHVGKGIALKAVPSFPLN